jgi:hypothetical protein
MDQGVMDGQRGDGQIEQVKLKWDITMHQQKASNVSRHTAVIRSVGPPPEGPAPRVSRGYAEDMGNAREDSGSSVGLKNEELGLKAE